MDTPSLKCDIPADWSNDFSQCLYDWQGLEGAALALLAAVAGVIFVQRQIKQAQAHRNDELARRHNAARLTLPLALSAVSDLVQKIADEVAGEFEKIGPDGVRTLGAILDDGKPRSRFNPITLHDNVIGSFEEFVASLTDARDIKHVAELIGNLQILLSRYNGFDFRQVVTRTGLAALLLDAAKVKLLNEKMFNYARFSVEDSFGIVGGITAADAWDQIHGSAQNLVFSRSSPDAFFPEFKERVDLHKKHGTSPWIEKFK